MTNPLQPGRQEEARNDLAHDSDLFEMIIENQHRGNCRIQQQAASFSIPGCRSDISLYIVGPLPPVNMYRTSQHVSVLSRFKVIEIDKCVCTRTTVKVHVEKVARSNDEGVPLIGSGRVSAKYDTPSAASTLNRMSQTNPSAAREQPLVPLHASRLHTHGRDE